MTKIVRRDQSPPLPQRIIEGSYVESGIYWKNTTGTGRILFVDRPDPTPKKPKTYLLHVDNNDKRHYISSLYSTNVPNVWNIDYQGTAYQVKSDPDNSLCISIGIILT
jgi:hypothetical protein